MSDVTTEMLAEIARAFNDHHTDAVLAFFADDAMFETPTGPDPCGRRLVGIDQVRGHSRALRRHPGRPLRRRRPLGQRQPGSV